MKVVRASHLAARAFELQLCPAEPVDDEFCAACGTTLEGQGMPFSPAKTFGDSFLLAVSHSKSTCPSCAALMSDTYCTSGPGSGVVSDAGFVRLASNAARTQFLVNPPEPPFAVAFVNAQRQHVWWCARTSYSKDFILLQWGHRNLTIDRPRALEAAQAITEYERDVLEMTGKSTFVFSFPSSQSGKDFSRKLLNPNDGQLSYKFQQDDGNKAKAVRSLINKLTLGDYWASVQVRAGMRETKTDTPFEAAAAFAALAANAAP